MHIKFSQDIIPLTDLKVNLGNMVNHSKDTHRPILLTSRIAAAQGLEEYENNEEKRVFIKAVATGLMEVREGQELELAEVKKKLGIE